jgi:hypothetical protein
MSEKASGRVTVPAYYQKLGGTRGYKNFDGSPEAWLWKQLMDESDAECIETAARIIEVYRAHGNLSRHGRGLPSACRIHG